MIQCESTVNLKVPPNCDLFYEDTIGQARNLTFCVCEPRLACETRLDKNTGEDTKFVAAGAAILAWKIEWRRLNREKLAALPEGMITLVSTEAESVAEWQVLEWAKYAGLSERV